jgi:RNA polymerase sigma factor (TIGR02999 family)
VNDLTRLLVRVEHGDPQAADELLPLVYAELRRLAAQKMAREAPGHTLQPTALVHEAWLRISGNERSKWNGRDHFFAAAAEAMRRILIENARRKLTLRRGGGRQRLEIEGLEIPEELKDDQLLALDEALEALCRQDKVKAQVVKLRFFVGLTNEEAAEILGLSAPTAKRYWAYARAWLYREMRAREGPHSL